MRARAKVGLSPNVGRTVDSSLRGEHHRGMGDDRLAGEGIGEDGTDWICPMCKDKTSSATQPFRHRDQVHFVLAATYDSAS